MQSDNSILFLLYSYGRLVVMSNVDVSLFFSFNNQKQSTDMMPIPVKVRCQLTNYNNNNSDSRNP